MNTRQNPWNIVPQYNNAGIFVGYGLRNPDGTYEKGKNNKPILINMDSPNWKMEAHDGCPEGCTISYGGATWKVSDSDMQEHIKPQIIYKPTYDKNGQFTGYDVERGNKKCGHLEPESISYKPGKNNNMQASWRDANGETHYIETLSAQKANERGACAEQNTGLSQKLNTCAQNITEDVRTVSRNIQWETQLVY